MRIVINLLVLTVLMSGAVLGQDRETKVRQDRQLLENDSHWIYNDLPKAMRQAKLRQRPVLMVLRCIPCEACHDFDEQVVEREARIRNLLDDFVCVRIPQANGLDLAKFQIDFDMSFAVIYLHHDGTVLGRFGTRTGRTNEAEDMHLDGFAESMQRAKDLSREFASRQDSLAGKQPQPVRYTSPEKFPSLQGKYTDRLNYEGKVVQSCIHCHQVREAERLVYRDRGQPVPDDVLFPWPGLSVIGLRCDPQTASTISSVEPDSPASRAGLKPGDVMTAWNGQPLVAVADAQWVLQQTGDSGQIALTVLRDGQPFSTTLQLPAGWRRQSDISWRATSWDLRRMVFGGMLLEPLTDEERSQLSVAPVKLALKVKHVGQYGNHARAKEAGVVAGDILVAYDGRDDLLRESDLLAYGMQQKKRGDKVTMKFLRNGQSREATVTLQ